MQLKILTVACMCKPNEQVVILIRKPIGIMIIHGCLDYVLIECESSTTTFHFYLRK